MFVIKQLFIFLLAKRKLNVCYRVIFLIAIINIIASRTTRVKDASRIFVNLTYIIIIEINRQSLLFARQ